MKPLKQILNESDTLKIRENINSQELVEMVELGLLEKNKLSLLERALNIDAELMTEAEKNIIVETLNTLITEKASSSKSLNLSSAGNTKQTDYMSDSKVPVIITFKRRSIRVFPNGIKIALYYSPQLDKYISIPFGEKSAETLGTNINEEEGASLMEETSFQKNLSEARTKSPKVIKYRPKKGKRKSTFKTKSLGKIKRHVAKIKKVVKKEPQKTVKPKVQKVKAKAKATPVKSTTPDVDKHTQIYAKAKQNYDNATSRPISVWDPEKKSKVTVDAKEHYKKIMSHHAEKIRASGGSLPSVEARRKPKRTPGIKPPPALAEQEQLNEFVGKLAKYAYRKFKNWATNNVEKNKNKSKQDDEADKEDRYTRKRKGDTPGLGRTETSRRITDDAARARATERTYRNAASGIDITHESNLELIRAIANNEGGKIDIPFDGNTVSINSRIAKKVLTVHESLNKTNKKNMEKMLNESVSSFRKVINFAIRQ